MNADGGLVTRIKVHMSEETIIDESTALLWFENILAKDPLGNPILFKVDTTNLKLVTDVTSKTDRTMPTTHLFHQNHPNPFNPETTIEYQLPQELEVILTIYDIHGKQVRRLVNEPKSPGIHSVLWDGRNDLGHTIASGVYFYRIAVKTHGVVQQSFVDVRKRILMK